MSNPSVPQLPSNTKATDASGSFIGPARITYIQVEGVANSCLLYTSPSPRDGLLSRMPSSA